MLITHVTLKRISQNKYSVFGHLTVHTKGYGRFMFNTVENYEERIEEGEYTLHREFSPRFGRFMLTVGGVPGRRGLRIHACNSGLDVRGCIGVGQFGISEDIPQYIYNSKLAVASLERLIERKYKTTIKIIDHEKKDTGTTSGKISATISELVSSCVGRTDKVGY